MTISDNRLGDLLSNGPIASLQRCRQALGGSVSLNSLSSIETPESTIPLSVFSLWLGFVGFTSLLASPYTMSLRPPFIPDSSEKAEARRQLLSTYKTGGRLVKNHIRFTRPHKLDFFVEGKSIDEFLLSLTMKWQAEPHKDSQWFTFVASPAP